MSFNEIGMVDRHGNLLAGSDTAYDSASHNSKEFTDWAAYNASADADLLGELGTIVARSNDLIRNNGVASGYSQTVVDKVVGPELRLAAKPNYLALGKDKEWASDWSRNVESKWRGYAASTEIDASRQLNFGGLTQLVMRSGIAAGESIVLPLWLKNRRYRTSFMVIDPIRMSNPDDQQDTRALRGGISVDRYGQALSYHVRKTHPIDVDGFSNVGEWERIPARTKRGRRQFIHVYDRKRPAQSRGEPWLSSVMGDFKMTGHYQKVQLRNAIANSLIAGFIESSMSVDDIATAFNSNYQEYLDGRKGWKSELQGGALIQLPPGDKMNPFIPSGSAAAFGEFMEIAQRDLSVGLNLPKEIVHKDFSKSNYSNTRAALAEAWTFLIGRRSWLAANWAQPAYELWLEETVMRGEIEAPDFYANKQAYCGSKWIGPGKGWLDVVKEAKGADLRIKIGQSTQQDECAEQGKDYEEVQDQRVTELVRAKKIAKDNDLSERDAYRIAGFSAEADDSDIDSYFMSDDEANGSPTPKPKQDKAA